MLLPIDLLGTVGMGGRIVLSEILGRCEDVCGLHSPAPLRTKEALDREAPLKAEHLAVVTNPVAFGQLLNAIARLMHWYIAVPAEHNHVFILIVSVVAYGALGVVLGHDSHVRVGDLLVFFEQDLA